MKQFQSSYVGMDPFSLSLFENSIIKKTIYDYLSYDSIIESVKVDDVIKYDGKKYNTCNYWKNNKKSVDYEKVLEKGNTKNWIDTFHTDYIVLNLPCEDWMKMAIGYKNKTGYFPFLYLKELAEYIDKYNTIHHVLKRY